MAAFLEKRRTYAARWGDGSEDMSTESDAVADDEHVCVFVLYRTSAGLSEASIYPNSRVRGHRRHDSYQLSFRTWLAFQLMRIRLHPEIPICFWPLLLLYGRIFDYSLLSSLTIFAMV